MELAITILAWLLALIAVAIVIKKVRASSEQCKQYRLSEYHSMLDMLGELRAQINKDSKEMKENLNDYKKLQISSKFQHS